MKISEMLDIPHTTCVRRYNELVRQSVEWDAEMDKNLEKSYQNHRSQMWELIARDLGTEWRAVEERVFNLGKKRFVKK